MLQSQGFPKNSLSRCHVFVATLLTLFPFPLLAPTLFAQGPISAQGPIFTQGPRAPRPASLVAPALSPAPFLAFELTLPEGCVALWPTRNSGGEMPALARLESGAKILLRPGYAHTFAVVTQEGIRQCVTLEVHDSLRLPPFARIDNHPAPLAIHPEDLIHPTRPRLITKGVCLLSNPVDNPEVQNEKANAEIPLAQTANMAKEAAKRGKLMGVIRLGNRSMVDSEIAQTAIPGTALLPGQVTLGPPALPPYIRPSLYQAGPDPILGPGGVLEEIIQDGGDRGQRMGIDGQGKIAGVDPEDSLASFTDGKGRRQVVHSNRVSIVAPRFQLLIQADPLDKFESTRALAMDVGSLNQGKVSMSQLPGRTATKEQSGDIKGRTSASATIAKEGIVKIDKITILEGQDTLQTPGETGGRLMAGRVAKEAGLKVNSSTENPRFVHGAVGLSGVVSSSGVSALLADRPGTDAISSSFSTRESSIDALCAEQSSSGPLELRKSCDKVSARPGEVLTFTLRFTNTSGHPIKDIGLVDALNPRLEYVEGTSQCSRDAIFLQQTSQGGGVELRWEIQGVLQPGDQAVVQFKTTVK